MKLVVSSGYRYVQVSQGADCNNGNSIGTELDGRASSTGNIVEYLLMTSGGTCRVIEAIIKLG
jgi:hypothetical protein